MYQMPAKLRANAPRSRFEALTGAPILLPRSLAEREMQAFVVRPVMTGLLALIIAGYWGTPLGIRGGGAIMAPASCHAVATLPPAAVGSSVLHRGIHC
jgi:hypothetical protein